MISFISSSYHIDMGNDGNWIFPSGQAACLVSRPAACLVSSGSLWICFMWAMIFEKADQTHPAKCMCFFQISLHDGGSFIICTNLQTCICHKHIVSISFRKTCLLQPLIMIYNQVWLKLQVIIVNKRRTLVYIIKFESSNKLSLFISHRRSEVSNYTLVSLLFCLFFKFDSSYK